MALALSKQTLAEIEPQIPGPNYNRDALKCGILHMSVGGFHRSHQAVYIHDLMNKSPSNWMICGVGLLPNDLNNINALKEQNGLYTVIERTANGDSAIVVGSMKEVIHAPSNPQVVIDRMMDPDIRIVSLTITEKGYYYDSTRNLDLNNDLIKNDLENPTSPKTMYGYVVGALARRRQNGMKPFTVMSCDNLPGNGHLTHKLILQFANAIDKELAVWIDTNVTFPNAMVDRITPVTTDEIVKLASEKFGVNDAWPVVCEDFRQWVLEDKFCDGRPALEEVGVQIVDEVDPYEKMKVRLLNSSHSALSYLSYLLGHRNVDNAMNDPLIGEFVKRYMDEDITPCVPEVPGVDLDAYKTKLIERFANPAISDQVQRLAEDGSTKIPNGMLACLRMQLANGGSYKWITLAIAGWFRYLRGIDEQGEAITIKDGMADRLKAAAQLDPRDPTALLGIRDIFGDDLLTSKEFVAEVTKQLNEIHEKGVKQVLTEALN
jgi:mannitol 2-dehydrogenase